MGKAEEIIRDMINDRYGSVRKFADCINVPNTTLYTTLERGIRATNSVDVVLKMFKELNLDVDALVGGMVRYKNADPDYVDVPLYGTIAAGTPIEMNPVDDYFPVPRPIAEKYPDGFLLEVKGTSMDRKLPDGCYAFIDPKAELASGRVYALNVNGYDATIKRMVVLENGFELQPDSTDPTHKTKVYDYGEPDTEQIRVIGRVVYHLVRFDFEY